MTRRAFLSLPFLGTMPPSSGFVLTGHMELAGEDKRQAYYSIAQGVALMIDPERLPSVKNGADALVGATVRLSLTRD